MSYASRSMRTRGRLNGSPVPVRSQRPLRVSAICASVCSVASARTCSTTAAGVRRRSGAARGSGHSIRRVAPPRQRMDTRITSSRSRVTSSMSSRSIRLRSRAGVRGSCQTRGRSATSAATRSFISGVTGGGWVLSAPAYASSAAASRWSASFQCRSRLSATSRFSGRTSRNCRCASSASSRSRAICARLARSTSAARDRSSSNTSTATSIAAGVTASSTSSLTARSIAAPGRLWHGGSARAIVRR